MERIIATEEQAKKLLNIGSFKNLSKGKVTEFISQIPNMDKEVAIKIIEQFPSFKELSTQMITQLSSLSEIAIKEDTKSSDKAVEAYQKVLDELSGLLKKNTPITEEEKQWTIDKMMKVADKISNKDTENKEFKEKIVKYGGSILGGTLLLGAAVLGVKVSKK